MIFYSKDQAYKECLNNPKLIFDVINKEYFDVVMDVLKNKKFDINVCDDDKNNVLMKLALVSQYELVNTYISDKRLLINHQNNMGNTICHILVKDNYLNTLKIVNKIIRNKDFIPNIKNNNNQTILDVCDKNSFSIIKKILNDKRFNSIDILEFRSLCFNYVINSYYGKKSSLSNLDFIIKSLDYKDSLSDSIINVTRDIKDNYNDIKDNIMNNNFNILEDYINNYI